MIFKDRSSQVYLNNLKKGELQVQGRGIVYILIRRALIIPEKRVVYVVVVSIVAYQDYQAGSM